MFKLKSKIWAASLCIASGIVGLSQSNPAMVFAIEPVVQATESPDDSQADEATDPKPEAPGKVDVKPVARDSEIETRLSDILDATEWFSNTSVEVDDGVVFLTGTANKADYKKWATELASKTQDVAAVVNRMKIQQKSIWDFSDAFAELREFRNSSIQAIPLILFAMVILAITWLAAKLVSIFANRVLTNRVPNNLLRWVMTRAIVLPVVIFGVYLVLRVAGLTQLALTVLGGTGLIGLVIGIAFQDIAENFLASILISVQKPFRIDDLITVGDHLGVVQRVTTRGTTLMTPDGNLVQIPNSNIYKSTITNYTASPNRRINFDIGIGYDDSATEAQTIVMDMIKNHEATLTDPPPRVLLDALGAATVNLRIYYWIDATKHDLLAVRSSVMRIAKQALQRRGISLPDEAREVIFPNGVPVLMNSESGESRSSNGSVSSREKPKPETANANSENGLGRLQPCLTQEKECAVSEAEGNMVADTEDLKRQAKKSWLPGEGSEVLVGGEEEDASVAR